jgi:hypothetical protein
LESVDEFDLTLAAFASKADVIAKFETDGPRDEEESKRFHLSLHFKIAPSRIPSSKKLWLPKQSHVFMFRDTRPMMHSHRAATKEALTYDASSLTWCKPKRTRPDQVFSFDIASTARHLATSNEFRQWRW